MSSQLLRLCGSIASVLLCIHSVRYAFTSSSSFFMLMHNVADLLLFFGFGFAGLVAELFPRESFAYKTLKANLPFMNNLIGRAVFYLLFGMFAMGNYTTPNTCTPTLLEDEGSSLWGFFCVMSGIFMVLVGAATLFTGLKYRISSPAQQEFLLTPQPINPVPQEPITPTDNRIMVPFAPFPTQV